MTRSFDIVLWGATGFTGALVAEYLVRNRFDGLRLALAGRNRSKLEALRDELAGYAPAAAELPLLEGDSFDAPSLRRLAESTKVVISTVGPYAKYGEALVAACAAAGTHYCDLTGEAPFVADMAKAHGEAARQSGARIVHCCGFDSIPSDLGTLMMHDAFEKRGGQIIGVRFFAGESAGGMSGGTIASMMNLIDAAKADRKVLKALVDPYSLYPEGERRGGDKKPQGGLGRDKELGMWTAPFVMAAINSKVVRRSNALMGFPYGRGFRYAEAMSTGRGVQGLLRAAAVTVVSNAMAPAMMLPPTRALLERKLPKPGEGPDRQARENGFFVSRLLAEGLDAKGRALLLRGKIRGENDPGYGETAKMLSESALCLAFDELSSEAGSHTPASAMGMVLVERLRNAGMTFEVAAEH